MIGAERVDFVAIPVTDKDRALTQRGMGEVTVVEKEHRVAMHQTGHNSGVVHAGLYYAPGSLKATLCARGRHLTRDYCLEKNLPYREVGKLDRKSVV